MSNRSYPADFSRPLREAPVANEAEIQAMLARLRRRCMQVSIKTNIDAASSAEPSFSAGMSVVSGTAAITATAGGGSTGASALTGIPFQSTRPASIATVAQQQEQLDLEKSRYVVGAIPTCGSIHGPGSGCEAELEQSSSLAPSAPALVWERISPSAMRTTCGTWTCCKVTVGGYPRYELWRRIAGLERPVRVKGGMTAFLEAQDLAEAESCD